MKKLYTAVGIMKQKRGEKGMTYPYEKLKRIRMFKNHRVDVKFASKELAHQFAEQYLGTVA